MRGGGDEFESGESVECFFERSAKGACGEAVEGGGEFVDEDGGGYGFLDCEIDKASDLEACVFSG